jgi:transcriptional accessory protein Tex/SPT6
MLNIPQLLAKELSLTPSQVHSALLLFAEGATISFIAHYLKQRTDSLDDVPLHDLSDRFIYLTELEQWKATILKEIAYQPGKMLFFSINITNTCRSYFNSASTSAEKNVQQVESFLSVMYFL